MAPLDELNAVNVVRRYDLHLPWIAHFLPFVFLTETAIMGAIGGIVALIYPACLTIFFVLLPVMIGLLHKKVVPWSFSYQFLFQYKCDFRDVSFAPKELYRGTPMEARHIKYSDLAAILEYCEKHIPSTKWYYNNGILKLAKRSYLIKLRLVFPFLNENFYGRLFKDK